MEGKTKLPIGEGKPEVLPVGALVRVIHARDPWLRRYSGMRAHVRQDDGLIVEVLLPCGHLMSFWRNEVKPVEMIDGWAQERSVAGGPHDLFVQHDAVPGRSLQGQRRRAGVTQAAIATVMRVSVPRISQIETAPAVRTVTAARYLEALRIASLSAA